MFLFMLCSHLTLHDGRCIFSTILHNISSSSAWNKITPFLLILLMVVMNDCLMTPWCSAKITFNIYKDLMLHSYLCTCIGKKRANFFSHKLSLNEKSFHFEWIYPLVNFTLYVVEKDTLARAKCIIPLNGPC